MYENIVRNSFDLNNLLRYFKFKSPLRSLSDGEEIKISLNEYFDIQNENEFLYFFIDQYKKNLKNSNKLIKELKKENNKLKKQNNKLKKENNKLKKNNKD